MTAKKATGKGNRRAGTSKPARQGKKAPTERKPPVSNLLEGQQKHKDRFLAGLACHGVVAGACEDAFISRTAAYIWRKNDAAFAAAWDAAHETAIDRMEKAAVSRAVDGVEEAVYGQGGQIGTKGRYSDSLLMFILKRHRPEYRDNVTQNVRHSGGVVSTVVRAEELTDDQLAAIIANEEPGQ